MGHEQEGLHVLEKEILQPDDGVDVQVVGRLVQEQDIRGRHQRARQERPALGSPRERRELSIGVEREARQNPLHLLVEAPPPLLLQRPLQALQALEKHLSPLNSQPVPHLVVLGKERRRVPHPRRHHVEHGAGKPLRDLLGDERHPEPLLTTDLTPVGDDLPVDQLHQGRFAGAVPPHEAEPVPRLQLQIHAVQERRAAEGEGDIS